MKYLNWCSNHASALTAAAKIQPIEFQNQRDVPIRSLAFLPVDGRSHPVSVSMAKPSWICIKKQIIDGSGRYVDFGKWAYKCKSRRFWYWDFTFIIDSDKETL